MMTIGIDLGGTNIRAGVESGGSIINYRKELLNANGSLAEILMQVIEFVRPLVTADVNGIGIGVPSVVDVEKGIVYNVVNIPSWQRVPLKDILEEEFGIPVRVNNDVNCFALGEHKFGMGKGFQNMVAVSAGTGLGAGIIINNQPFFGNNCGAGEIGLLPYRDHNIEYYASGNLFRAVFKTSAEEAHRQAVSGNPEAIRQWDEFGIHMAEALKCVVLAYDPGAIILGGSLSKAYDLFNRSMREALQVFTFPESIKRLKIFRSQNENIVLLGAAEMVTSHIRSIVRTA